MSDGWESAVMIVAQVLVGLGGLGFLIRAVLGPSLADRVVAIDGMVVAMVAAVILESIRSDHAWFLEVALVVAFVGFVGTAASARFIEGRGA